tara:strand:+ start:298 stop:528 length:231 start_codon:yes stop_codon:yes gene_type:complete
MDNNFIGIFPERVFQDITEIWISKKDIVSFQFIESLEEESISGDIIYFRFCFTITMITGHVYIDHWTNHDLRKVLQ